MPMREKKKETIELRNILSEQMRRMTTRINNNNNVDNYDNSNNNQFNGSKTVSCKIIDFESKVVGESINNVTD